MTYELRSFRRASNQRIDLIYILGHAEGFRQECFNQETVEINNLSTKLLLVTLFTQY